MSRSIEPNAQLKSGNRGNRLDSKTKTAIVAQVIAGATQASVAQAVGVHRNTVNALVRDVMEKAPEAAQLDWRKKLSETIPAKAVSAIERSVEDLEDIHKAAGTGVQVLKGLGHLAGEGNTTNIITVMQQIHALPPDLRACYLSNDDAKTIDVSDADIVSVDAKPKRDNT